MTETGFFKWLHHINALLLLPALILGLSATTYASYMMIRFGSSSPSNNEVVINKKIEEAEKRTSYLLDKIHQVSGHDTQYMMLNAQTNKRSHGKDIRNVVFFEGQSMQPHWLFDINTHKFEVMKQLKKPIENSSNEIFERTVAIYYQLRDQDSNHDGFINHKDDLTLALTSANGDDYTVIDQGVKNIIDYSIDEQATEMTILTQFKDDLVMKKYALESKQMISERVITRISKKH